MIDVKTAESLILQNTTALGTEYVSLDDALGRILAEDIYADRDAPPYHRVTMDGFLMHDCDTQATVLGSLPAGAPSKVPNPGEAYEIWTGASFPKNCGLMVVPYEQTERNDATVFVKTKPEFPERFVHMQGSDSQKGALILKKRTYIGVHEISALASFGAHRIKVTKKPRVYILSTGNEVVPVDSEPSPQQIRRSNAPMVKAFFKSHGVSCFDDHVCDNQEQILKHLEFAIETFDAVIIIGGVSAGGLDLIPQCLQVLGIEKIFHKIAQRPGKPMFFGKRRTTVIFGLPGNSVSSALCAQRYLLPWLRHCQQKNPGNALFVKTENVIPNDSSLTLFLPVTLNQDWTVNIKTTNTSGDHLSLLGSDGFIEVPALSYRQSFNFIAHSFL